ncbi:hypothetical protein R4P64_24020 [Rhodococcus sp. IEGM 1366]|uniref:hypothetical protein n=1 Tax=Rhodococcus sp. IEGM 1366 TaxID=3082223 RepID=UPI002953D0BE|nr:hypothetical protein [Rhodococcus sp. IEGM 1366]MDV8069600.1 hypothetical protein [Rhodococcus sp. IEGM 1366]
MSVADVEERWLVLGYSARAAQLTDFLAVPLFCRTITCRSAQSLLQKSFESSVRDRDQLTVLADCPRHALAAHDDKRGSATGALRDAIGARVDVERAVASL